MTINGPRINEAGFVAVQRNKVVALVPDGRLPEATAALAGAGVDLTRVDVLQGEIGARILDFDGTEHGFLVHAVRSVQKLGTASNERENFSLALRHGQSIIIVPVLDDTAVDLCARILSEHGCRRIIHFSKWAVEPLSFDFFKEHLWGLRRGGRPRPADR
jgi:hypothetical protein